MPAASEEMPAVENPDCGVWHRAPVSTIDWSLRTRPVAAEPTDPGLRLRIGEVGTGNRLNLKHSAKPQMKEFV